MHLYDILGQPVFSSQLKAQWKVIDLLSASQSLVEIRLSLRVGPEHVPIVPVGAH